jgi:hypothetical protein
MGGGGLSGIRTFKVTRQPLDDPGILGVYP